MLMRQNLTDPFVCCKHFWKIILLIWRRQKLSGMRKIRALPLQFVDCLRLSSKCKLPLAVPRGRKHKPGTVAHSHACLISSGPQMYTIITSEILSIREEGGLFHPALWLFLGGKPRLWLSFFFPSTRTYKHINTASHTDKPGILI